MTAATLALHVINLGWGILCGAMIYEHVAVIPAWAKAPPVSLTMWRGEHRLKAERFWMTIHPLLLIAFAVAIATNWSAARPRELLLIAAGGYAVIIATTAIYYVPELMKLTRDPDAPIPAPEWRRRARRWELLSLIRGAGVLAIAWPILRALAHG